MKKFTEYLDDFSFDDLVALWNEYASDTGDGAYVFDSIEDFADNYEHDALELARKVFFGDVKSWGDMVYLDGYENFQSCWNVENSPIDIDAMAEWMKESNHHEYKEWLDNIDADDFADWLGGELTNEELTELWGDYIAEVDEDDLADNGLPYEFDITVLASEMMSDWHQHFDDFIDSNI